MKTFARHLMGAVLVMALVGCQTPEGETDAQPPRAGRWSLGGRHGRHIGGASGGRAAPAR